MITLRAFCYPDGWFHIRVMFRPFDFLERFRDHWIRYLHKCTLLNCTVTLIFNCNRSVRELTFGLPLKNSKSFNAKTLDILYDYNKVISSCSLCWQHELHCTLLTKIPSQILLKLRYLLGALWKANTRLTRV